MPNRLAHETSSYLRQHAENPVDWYPWCAEAFARARAEDKPVLVSIGYAACHWCHVMAHESFDDPEIARLMNERFINIKVDREERPDLDQIYQTACQLMTGGGGWPLTVFCTPEREPFYVGTYFPKTPRYNLPGFGPLLAAVSETYAKQRTEVERNVERMKAALAAVEAGAPSEPSATSVSLAAAVTTGAEELARVYDSAHGGFGGAPKFPMPTVCQFLLRHGAMGNEASLEMALTTLRKMSEGGVCDQVGGGFHRYSVDERWLVPHFEKMLYDNALLIPLYTDAFCRTGDNAYRDAARATVNYLCREMREGDAFASSHDADSEGEEGKYYTWGWDELRAQLSTEELAVVGQVYGATEGGNFEGKNILFRAASISDSAAALGRSVEEVAATLHTARQGLLNRRAQRLAPGRATQLLTGWNALTIAALAHAGMGLAEPEYIATAETAWDAVHTHCVRDGSLYHIAADSTHNVPAFADDYAYLIAAAIACFFATGAPKYLESALGLTSTAERRFLDPATGQLYLSGTDTADVIVRPRALNDQPLPSATAIYAECCFRLAALTGIESYRDKAHMIWRGVAANAGRHPMAMAALLAGMTLADVPPLEIVIVGQVRAAVTREMLAAGWAGYHPERIIFPADPALIPVSWRDWPLLAGRLDVEEPTAFVCRAGVCQAPITDPQLLRTILKKP